MSRVVLPLRGGDWPKTLPVGRPRPSAAPARRAVPLFPPCGLPQDGTETGWDPKRTGERRCAGQVRPRIKL